MKQTQPFLKKGDLRITKNYKGITVTVIAAKVYNYLLFNCIQLEIEKILRENQKGFWRNHITISQILTRSTPKNLKATLLYIDFSKALDSIYREKMEQILLGYSPPNPPVRNC